LALQQSAQLIFGYFIRRAVGQYLKLLEKLDYLSLLVFA